MQLYKFFAVTIMALSVNAFAQDDAIKLAVKASSLQTTLKRLYENKNIQFNPPTAEADYLKALNNIDSLTRELNEMKLSLDDETDLNYFIEKARTTQKQLSSFFGEMKDTSYTLKKGLIVYSGDIQITAKEKKVRRNKKGKEKKNPIASRLPDLDGSGSVKTNPKEKVLTEFNSLRAEFYGYLTEALHLAKDDSRIRSLVNWGRRSEVTYAQDDSTWVVQPILTDPEILDLGLELNH